MKLRTLAIATLVLVAAAVGAVTLKRSGQMEPTSGRLGKPLLETIDMAEADSISIMSEGQQVTMWAKDGGWVVEEQAGFPASEEAIRQFLFKLNKERVEHKVTENPARLAELGLLTVKENGDKFEKDKTAVTFAIHKKGGDPLFELLIGQDRTTGPDIRGALGGQYVRFPGETAAYLIPEPLFINKRPEEWIQKEFFEFDKGALLKEVRVAMPGKKALVFFRAEEKDPWKLKGHSGAGLDQQAVDTLARRVAGLELFKVAQPGLDAAALGRKRLAQVDVELFDKRSYQVEIGMEDGEGELRYVTASAKLDPSVTDEALRKQVIDFNAVFRPRVVGIYNWEAKELLKERQEFFADDKKK